MFANKSIKLISAIVLILTIIILSSCRLIENINNYKPKKRIYIDNMGNEIIRCLNEKDKQSLSALFCDKVKNTDYLNRQIDFFFDYIYKQGGLFIDDSGKWVDGGGHGANSGGRRVIEYQGCNYDKDVEIGNKKYLLSFGRYDILLRHKEYEGITLITFRDVRDISDATLEQTNIALNDKTPGKYLGIGIFNTNWETYLRENVAPKEIYENEEYRFDDDELEKNHDNW